VYVDYVERRGRTVLPSLPAHSRAEAESCTRDARSREGKFKMQHAKIKMTLRNSKFKSQKSKLQFKIQKLKFKTFHF
jgi:hypothetical protein